MLRSMIAFMAATAISANAQAMDYNANTAYPAANNKVSLGLVIPIGRGGKSHERKPRLELGFDHRANRQSVEVVGTELKSVNTQNARIGLSLSKDPHLMFNGREVPKAEGRYNLSTVAWIGIGLVAAAGIGVIVIWQQAEANSQ